MPTCCLAADAVIQACCLKTHRFGGHFTLSLKNAVGLVAKSRPGESYNYMNELHGSAQQRRMIAEINAAYRPALVVLDGVDASVPSWRNSSLARLPAPRKRPSWRTKPSRLLTQTKSHSNNWSFISAISTMRKPT